MEFVLEYKVQQSKNGKFPSQYKLAQSIHKPLQKKAPQKGPLKNISPAAYFRNFTVWNYNFGAVFDQNHKAEIESCGLPLKSPRGFSEFKHC